jgi:hypothetical protein
MTRENMILRKSLNISESNLTFFIERVKTTGKVRIEQLKYMKKWLNNYKVRDFKERSISEIWSL